MDWIQTVLIIVAFALVLSIVLSFIYRLVAADVSSEKDDFDCLSYSIQDLTDLSQKQSIADIFIKSGNTPRKNQQIVAARAFAEISSNDDEQDINFLAKGKNTSVGYIVDYAKSETSAFCERYAFVLSAEPGTKSIEETVVKLDALLDMIAEKKGFTKKPAVIYD